MAPNDHFIKKEISYSDSHHSDTIAEVKFKYNKSGLINKSAAMTKYGYDLLKVSGSELFGRADSIETLTLRTGINSLSKNAAASVQLIVSW